MSQADFDGIPDPSSVLPVPDQPRRVRLRLALPALGGVASDPAAPRWRHWIVAVETIGRITLPATVRELLGDRQTAQAVSRGRALVIRRGGTGAAVVVDRRGRVVLPTWLRRASSDSKSVLVSASADNSTIIVVSTTELDAVVAPAAGEVG